MNPDHFLTPYTKINSKWMKDLNGRQEAMKILEEKAGKTSLTLATATVYSTHVRRQGKQKQKWTNYCDLTKIKTFCTVKETISKTKRRPTEWEKIFANDISDRELVFKIYKELIKLNTQKTNNPVKKWAKDMNRHFFKEDIQMANQHMKTCSTSLIIREIQIKTTLRYHLTPVRVAIMNKSWT